MLKKKKYKHIFFDLDNTLWDFKKNSALAMSATFLHFSIKNIPFTRFFEIYEKHNHQLWMDYRNKKIAKKELIRLRFQKTFDELAVKGIDPAEMNEHYLHEMPKQKELNEGAAQLLESLSISGFQLYIITNGFKEVQHKKLESSGLAKYFKRIFISEEVKSPKPAREIFEYAIKSSNAKKTESIMIGDDWDVDVMGAVKFGIDAVFYSNKQRPEEQFWKNQKIYTVHGLFEIEKFL